MAADGYSHQDWKTVVMKPPKEATQTHAVAKTQGATTTQAGKPAWKVEQQTDSEVGKPVNYVSTDIARTIIGGRTAAKLTQKQLAQRLNIPEKDIKEIEAGKAIENKGLLSRIKRALNV
jgi:ribosome-binding protein aMBF1 (putative translation factor)